MSDETKIEESQGSSAAGLGSSELLATLDLWGRIAHAENGGFVERFCPKAWTLTQLSWDSENMRFVYILDCGKHVSDSVKITQWMDFLSDNAQAQLRES